MKGYWHLPSFGLVVAFLVKHVNSYIFLVIYFLWLYYLFYRKRLQVFPFMITMIVFLLFLFHLPKITPPDYDSELFLMPFVTGKIISAPESTDTYLRFILKEDQSKDRIIYHYFFSDSTEGKEKLKEISYGSHCKISSEIKLPEESTNPGQFNYSKYLLQQGISFESTISSLKQINCSSSNPLHYIFSLRNKLISHTSTWLSEETASWLNALVLGDDSQLSEDLVHLFNRWSLSHILAISGLHVGLIVGLLYFFLVKLNIITKEKAKIFTLIFLPIYALLAGGAPSVWRASLMGFVFILLSKFNIKYSVTDIISIIFIVLLAFDPYLIFHIGFQFSFLVTFGLLLSRKWLMQTNSPIWQLMKISFISQMIIIPLQLNYFYFFQPLSILVNTIVVPYFSLFVIPGMFVLLLSSIIFPRLTLVFDQLFAIFHDFMIKGIFLFDKIFHNPWIIGEIPLRFFVFYYLFLYLLMKSLERKSLLKSFYIGLTLVVFLTVISIKPYLSEEGYVTMLDIGQGDAFVIELPFRKGVIFVDAGARFSFDNYEASDKVYRQVLEPYLHSRGIAKVDAVILSHEDLDHSGSLAYLIENFSVDQVVVSEYYEFSIHDIEIMMEYNVEPKRVAFNEIFSIKGLFFQVLSPERDYKDFNDNSLVILSNIGGRHWLFTGDISKEIERKIVESFDRLHVDVLKVAHHGSNTSTDPEFIRKVNPEYALISVGRNNRYGHPALGVLDALESVKILRTDLHGAVQYKFIEDKGNFKTFQKN